jgi:hypothetical protein
MLGTILVCVGFYAAGVLTSPIISKLIGKASK